MITRRKCRIIAFQALYSWDVGGTSVDNLLNLSWIDENEKYDEALDEESETFVRLLINGTVSHIEEIDGLIKSHLSPSWTMERLNKVTLAILRMSVYSLLYQSDLHPTIIIDEAIDIVKMYGQDDSFKFINAILDKIAKEVRKVDSSAD